MSYFTLVTTRNRPRELKLTIESLVNQTQPPTTIIIFDDGSTPPVKANEYRNCILLRREDEGFDITRIPKNWNLMLATARKLGILDSCDFMLISNDDCVYPTNYSEALMQRMHGSQIAVASGSRGIRVAPDGFKPPEGTGRFVEVAYLRSIMPLPERAGYESYMFLEAMRQGRRVACYEDLTYDHMAEFGKSHCFQEWGHMGYSLGYDPLFFLFRCIKNLATREIPITATIRMYLSYLKDHIKGPTKPFYSTRFDSEFRHFVGALQRRRLKGTLHQGMQGIRSTLTGSYH